MRKSQLIFLRMVFKALFSSRETCAWEIPISSATSVCVIPFINLIKRIFFSLSTYPLAIAKDIEVRNGGAVMWWLRESTPGKTAAACAHYGSADLHGLIEVRAVEESVEKCDQGSVCRGIVNGTSDNEAVRLLEFLCDLVEVRKLLNAGGTPCSPEVYYYRFAAERIKLYYIAVFVLKSQTHSEGIHTGV